MLTHPLGDQYAVPPAARPRRPAYRMRIAALTGIAALLGSVAACGSDPAADDAASSSSATGEAAFPVTVEAANGPVTLDARPEKIVSLTPTSTETLFEIGAGDQVVAVDDNSNYPADTPKTDLSGFQPNVEAISSYQPDLVVVSNDINSLLDGLAKLKIPVVLIPSAETIDDAYDQINQLGELTGHSSEATDLVGQMKADITDIVDSAPADTEGLTYYYELDPTYYSVTSKTFIGSLLAEFGLVNIADEADDAAGGFPQLSSEYIVDADPDLIFLADTKCCGENATTVTARDGWDVIRAVKTGDIVELDDDIASRWGPRIVDLLKDVADGITAAAGQ